MFMAMLPPSFSDSTAYKTTGELGRGLLASPRVRAPGRQHERIAGNRLALEIAEVGLQRQQGRVQRAGLDGRDQRGRLVLGPANGQLGPSERGDDSGEQVRGD